MARRVRFHSDALADLTRQAAWLERYADASWLDRFQDELTGALKVLSLYPGAGAVVDRAGEVVLRRVPLPSTPYIVCYLYEERRRRANVWIVRVLHSRQKRPAPDLSRWVSAADAER